jgi:hypothetical protein
MHCGGDGGAGGWEVKEHDGKRGDCPMERFWLMPRRGDTAIGVVSCNPGFGDPWEWFIPFPQDVQNPKMITPRQMITFAKTLGVLRR